MTERIPSNSETPKRSLLSLPLDEYEKMRPEQFQAAAEEAGVTIEKLKELVTKAALNKQTDEQARVEQRVAMDARANEQVGNQTHEAQIQRFLPHEVRRRLEQMRPSPADLATADELEKKAYAIFDKQTDPTYSSFSFYQAERIRARARLYDLRENRTLDQMIGILRAELKEKAAKTNIPPLRDALERVSKELRAPFQPSRQGKTVVLDSYGSAEKFSANAVSAYVKNPRPRRYNDELDHD